MGLDPSSRARLNQRSSARFQGNTLFDRIARTLCRAECLPRKELYEAWEVARRVRRIYRGGRVLDLAAGHGLLAHLLLILDDTSPQAIAVDRTFPASAGEIARVLVEEWPRLAGRVEYREASLDDPDAIAIESSDLLVSIHACGRLTDRVLDLAIAAKARVAVLPCCHEVIDSELCGLAGWLDGPLAVDVCRANRLSMNGFNVRTSSIPRAISPKNRLLIAQSR